MSIIHVVGQDDAEVDAWALARHDLAAGVVAISVPHASPSLSSIAHEIADGLGLDMEANPHVRPEVDLLELVYALIRGYGIRELILVHGDWLALKLVDDFARWVTLLGLQVFVITHPPVGVTGWLEGWRTEEIGWSEFVARWTASDPQRAELAADPARHQRVALPSIGIRLGSEPMAVPAHLDGSVALAGYAQLRAALSGAEISPGRTSTALRSVLRTCQTAEELDRVLPGVARALAQAGLALRVNAARLRRPAPSAADASGDPVWADLRRSGGPAAAAAIALLGVDLAIHEVSAVRLIDIAIDGSWVADTAGFRPLSPAARPFVVAMRHLRIADGAGPEDPFIAGHGRPVRPSALARLVSGTFADLGIAIDTDELRRRLKPNERWLYERGLVVTGTRSATHCRHGLPSTVPVEGANLSHSQRVCRVMAPSDTRTAAGSVVELVEEQAGGAVYRVTRRGEPAGHVWLIHTRKGPAWLDIGSDATPTIEAITEAIRRNHPRCVLTGSGA